MEISMETLQQLARLLAQRDALDAQIARLISRPVERGHVGEYLAAHLFDITLEQSASHPGYDGRFASGPLKDHTVNVKWYARHNGLLTVKADTHWCPDYYLVLTGPKGSAGSSRRAVHPWVIDFVFLLDGPALLTALKAQGRTPGIATSLNAATWAGAEVYPVQRTPLLPLTSQQQALLALFHSPLASTQAAQ